METTGINVSQPPADQLIAGLCDANAALRERCRALEELATSRADDAESYRLLARQAIHAYHQEQLAHTRLRGRYERLVDEYREHRARVLTDQDRAA